MGNKVYKSLENAEMEGERYKDAFFDVYNQNEKSIPKRGRLDNLITQGNITDAGNND